YSGGTGTVRKWLTRCVDNSTTERTIATPTTANPAKRLTVCRPSAASGSRAAISSGSQRDGTRNAGSTCQSSFDGIETPATGLGSANRNPTTNAVTKPAVA